ncbi:type I restriction endonuclease, partial [Streptococcus suis]|nr:type I restriction endonuclease [Streptococcus suis]
MPESWEWVRLRNLGIITSGGTPKSSEPSYYGGDIIWITPADLGKQQKNKLFSTSSKTITELGLQK